MTRRLAVCIAAAAITAAVFAAQATAAITGSQITSPSDPAYAMEEENSTAVALTVSGTTTGTPTEPVDIDCFDGQGGVTHIKSNVPTSGNAFSVDVTRGDLWNTTLVDPCVIRAVPAGDAASRPPSATSDPYQGPRLAVTWGDVSNDATTGQNYDFYYDNHGIRGGFQFKSAQGGIASSHVYDPATLAASPGLIGEASAFSGGNLIKVDGVDSYVPYAACCSDPGWFGIASIHTSLDPATGNLVVQDREPLSKDSDPWNGSYVPSGVELDRTWTSDSQGRVAHLVDSWRSTDGQQHTLQIQYESSYSTSAAGSTLDFPGSSGYQDYAAGDSVTLPSGTGTIYFKYDGTTPDAGDGTNPQGAVTYETAPDAPASIEGRSSSGIEWLLPYNPTIPAGGTVTLRFNWSQAFSRSDLDSFAQQAIASWQPPPPPPQQQNGPPSSPNTGTPPQQQTEAPGLALIGKVKTTGNGFSFTLACTNGPCNGGATLTTTELLKGSKVLHLARTKHKKVTIGRTTFTIASGGHKTITVKLNAAGKKLLKRFNKLPAKLSVTLNGKTVVAKKATLKKR